MGLGPWRGHFHKPSWWFWCTLKFGTRCSCMKKRMLSPFYTQFGSGEGCPSKSCLCPKVFQRWREHCRLPRAALSSRVHTPPQFWRPLLWGAGNPSPPLPQAWPRDCARFVKSDSFQVRLVLRGASPQAARTRSYVCVCLSSWGGLSSSPFPRSTTTPTGKWGAAVYLGTGGAVVHQLPDTLPQLPPAQDILLNLALKTLSERWLWKKSTCSCSQKIVTLSVSEACILFYLFSSVWSSFCIWQLHCSHLSPSMLISSDQAQMLFPPSLAGGSCFSFVFALSKALLASTTCHVSLPFHPVFQCFLCMSY